jgi:hypothetical protein
LLGILVGNQRLVHHDGDRRARDQARQLGPACTAERLFTAFDVVPRQTRELRERRVEVPGAVGIDPQRALRPDRLANGGDPLLVELVTDLDLDLTEPLEEHLARQRHCTLDARGRDHPAVPDVLLPRRQHGCQAQALGLQPAVHERQLDGAAGRIIGDHMVGDHASSSC